MLKPLMRDDKILIWDDTRIKPGTEWRDQIEATIASSSVAVLLVSPYFLASDFIDRHELAPLLETAKKAGLTILWIPVSASLYQVTEIAKYHAAHDPSEPLDSLSPPEQNQALVKICEKIKAAATVGPEDDDPGGESEEGTDEGDPQGEDFPGPDKPPSEAGLKIALLYKRNVPHDEDVLELLEKELTAEGYRVFIDRHLKIGVEWAVEIEREVRTADAVIPLLSATSVASEMMAYEIQMAHESAQKNNGKPRLLPVRVAYEGPLPDPLGSIFNPIQYALWRGPQDDEALVSNLLQSLRTPPTDETVVPPWKLGSIGGAVPLDSKFYIERPADKKFYEAIERRDIIVLLKGARQMGKTSLLIRGIQRFSENGAESPSGPPRAVITDLQKLNATHLQSIESFFQSLAELMTHRLGLNIDLDRIWNSRSAPNIKFENFLREEVMGQIKGPLMWGIDEADRLFTYDYGSDVFGLFRSWQNELPTDMTDTLKRLTLAISYATEPHLFISDPNISPFNVGTKLRLEDFTLDQVTQLNISYGRPLDRHSAKSTELGRFYNLVAGHPYLVRRGLHEMATNGLGINEFEEQADRDEGLFGDHLRRILVLLVRDAELTHAIKEILEGRPCPSEEAFYRLSSAGVLADTSVQDAKLHCQLYTNYLKRHLLGKVGRAVKNKI